MCETRRVIHLMWGPNTFIFCPTLILSQIRIIPKSLLQILKSLSSCVIFCISDRSPKIQIFIIYSIFFYIWGKILKKRRYWKKEEIKKSEKKENLKLQIWAIAPVSPPTPSSITFVATIVTNWHYIIILHNHCHICQIRSDLDRKSRFDLTWKSSPLSSSFLVDAAPQSLSLVCFTRDPTASWSHLRLA